MARVSKVLLLSGGMDSATLLWNLKPDVKCLSFHYGQRHERELEMAEALCDYAEVEHQIVDLYTSAAGWLSVSDVIKRGSLTGSETVPEGHYAEESMKKTIVPNRNMIMLSIAAGWAVATGAREVLWAAHAGDHTIYPDCRPEFLDAMAHAIRVGNAWEELELRAPFIHISKAEVLNIGLKLEVPYELTWSCYNGRAKPCGKCGTCVERLEAFALNNATDPLQYETAEAARG